MGEGGGREVADVHPFAVALRLSTDVEPHASVLNRLRALVARHPLGYEPHAPGLRARDTTDYEPFEGLKALAGLLGETKLRNSSEMKVEAGERSRACTVSQLPFASHSREGCMWPPCSTGCEPVG